jgi:hypothetical protein
MLQRRSYLNLTERNHSGERVVVLARPGFNHQINRFLGANPLLLGLLLLVIGGALLGSGIYEFRSGVTRDKRGREIQGMMAKPTSHLRIVEKSKGSGRAGVNA